MAAGFSGRLVLLKRGDGGAPESFTTVAALRTNTFDFSEATVDTTSKDDSGARSLLSGSILKSCSVSGSGVFTDVAAMQSLYDDYAAGTHTNFQLDVVGTDASTGGYVFEGAFRTTALSYTGDFDAEAQYSITLESDGAITAS